MSRGDSGSASLGASVAARYLMAAPLLDRVLQATPATDARYRARLLAWARAAVRLGADERARAVALLDGKAGLFAAADCPPEQRAEFERLRAKPQ